MYRTITASDMRAYVKQDDNYATSVARHLLDFILGGKAPLPTSESRNHAVCDIPVCVWMTVLGERATSHSLASKDSWCRLADVIDDENAQMHVAPKNPNQPAISALSLQHFKVALSQGQCLVSLLEAHFHASRDGGSELVILDDNSGTYSLSSEMKRILSACMTAKWNSSSGVRKKPTLLQHLQRVQEMRWTSVLPRSIGKAFEAYANYLWYLLE